jgi:hypothetical protein
MAKKKSTVCRNPPPHVKQQLRREAGFGCPMPDAGTDYCGSPYLQYHHFDPPWCKEKHHDPDRMIALCATHHGRADNLTVEQVREVKQTALERAGEVAGRLDWMRRDLLLVTGTTIYYKPKTIVAVKGNPLLWFTRNAKDELLINAHTPDAKWRQRVSLLENDWVVRGNPADVESPPKGRSLAITYADGDRLQLRFQDWDTEDALAQAFPLIRGKVATDHYPVTTVSIDMRLQGFGIDLSNNTMLNRHGMTVTMTNCFFGEEFKGTVFNLN